MADPVLDQDPSEDNLDPQSGIASILRQMQAAADRSRPLETVQNANRPMPATNLSPDDLISMLLGGATGRAMNKMRR